MKKLISKYSRDRYLRFKNKYPNYYKNYWIEHKLEETKKRKIVRDKVKKEVFNAYGGAKCVCCGEDEIKFLTIDHIVDKYGATHRREIKVGCGYQFYLWLKKNKYPPEFQVLCFNCNCGRSVNGGICPHKSRKL